MRKLADPGYLVVDPFGGSCVTGEVCEALERCWLCCEMVEDYLRGAVGRFLPGLRIEGSAPRRGGDDAYYRVPRPGALIDGTDGDVLDPEGGRRRKPRSAASGAEGDMPVAASDA